MKIVIIGAGISGLGAFLELRKHLPKRSASEDDHEITIYEAYDTNKDVDAEQREQGPTSTHSSTLLVGGGLAVAPNGLGVLQRLDPDLLKDVTLSGYVVSHSNLKNKNGGLLMRIEPNGHNSWKDAGPAARMHSVSSGRHALWRCLRTRVPDEHIVNKRVSEIVAHAEGRNIVRFSDGSEPVEADLVIGADGIRSIARQALFPDAKEDPYPPHYEGVVGVGGFVPATDFKDIIERGSMNFVFGGNGFFGYVFTDSAAFAPNRHSPYHVSAAGESLGWWSTYEIKECPDYKNLDMDDVVRQLRERYAQWKDPVVQRIVKSVEIRNMYPTWTMPPLPTWERDGVVLLGDAAHALPPTSGQGASQALEDCEAFAIFLAHHLHKVCQKQGRATHMAYKRAINIAAKQYTTLRKPRVKDILESAQRIQGSKKEMGAIQECTMYSFMKIFGLFPSLVAKPARKVNEYNIVEQVAQVLATEH